VLREKVIASRTWTKKLPATHPLVWGTRPSYTLSATAKLYSLGDQAPYFSLTGELCNLRKRNDPVEMGGCMHEELVREWPELAPLAAIHLSDENGVPMHAVDNGAYWLGFSVYKTATVQGNKEVDLPYFPYFCNLWRVSEEEARAIYMRVSDSEFPKKAALTDEATWMADRWKAEADKALAIILNQ
jgi:hypothetical protein